MEILRNMLCVLNKSNYLFIIDLDTFWAFD